MSRNTGQEEQKKIELLKQNGFEFNYLSFCYEKWKNKIPLIDVSKYSMKDLEERIK